MMDHLKVYAAVLVFFCFALCSNGALASSSLKQINEHLYAGETKLAEEVAKSHLNLEPDDNQIKFTLGAVQFLRSVERLGQDLHRYGLRTSYRDPTGLSGLPFLRLPVEENSNPEDVTYSQIREVIQTFVENLKLAERTLSAVEENAVDLQLNFGLVRLDLNSDGKGTDNEALWRLFKRVSFSWLEREHAEKLTTDFDESDVPWLQAYCHLLMAIGEFVLAHDWESAFNMTFHNLFPHANLPSSAIAEADARWVAELKKLSEPPKKAGDRYTWYQSPEGLSYNDIEMRLSYGSIADMIAFVHLNHWPVVEPERMMRALTHLQEMAKYSRESWRRILAETDDREEWIPAPSQTSVLPRMTVSKGRVEGWHRFLDEFEALLAGKKLLPHFRFEKGINLRRFFLEPRTFDLVLLVQGSAAIPYLEKGEMVSRETWNEIRRLSGGNFFQYAVWFN